MYAARYNPTFVGERVHSSIAILSDSRISTAQHISFQKKRTFVCVTISGFSRVCFWCLLKKKIVCFHFVNARAHICVLFRVCLIIDISQLELLKDFNRSYQLHSDGDPSRDGVNRNGGFAFSAYLRSECNRAESRASKSGKSLRPAK